MSFCATRKRRGAVAAVAAAVCTSALVLPVLPAQAGGDHGHEPAEPEKIASGLDNPRQLTVTDRGVVYVAESGAGGDGPCFEGPEDDEVCFGESGAITRITRWGQRQVVTGLPSIAAPDGTDATGPSDVASLGDGKLAVLLGLGAPPADRDAVPAAKRLGTIQLAQVGRERTRTIADIAAHEADENPIHGLDSNPVGLLETGSRFRVADAGGNTLVSATWWGRTRTRAVFPDLVLTGAPVPAAQSVPTDVVQGRDGALYVSELTGFPFPAGQARIWRVVPGEEPTVYATGLTNVTSLAVDRKGRLFAVQISDEGLLTVGPGELSSGSLVRVRENGEHTVVADDLVAPYGVAITGSTAYVTTCAVQPGAAAPGHECAEGGEVWAFSTRGSSGGGGGGIGG